MTEPPIHALVSELNTLSQQRLGLCAPTYYCAPGCTSLDCTVHCIRSSVSPCLPSEEVWARGDLTWVSARLRRALDYLKQ